MIRVFRLVGITVGAACLAGCVTDGGLPEYVCKGEFCTCGPITWSGGAPNIPKERPVQYPDGSWYCKSGANIYGPGSYSND